MFSLGVRNQVGEKCWCKPVLLGPDGEGPAEISTEKKRLYKELLLRLLLSHKKLPETQ